MPDHVILYSEQSGQSLDFGDRSIDESIPVVSKQIITSASGIAFSGQINISGSSVAVVGPDITDPNGFIVKLSPLYNNQVWVFSAHLTKADGFPLDSSTNNYLAVSNLNLCKFQADYSGSAVVCWIKG